MLKLTEGRKSPVCDALGSGCFRGRVHSVFSSGFHLELRNTAETEEAAGEIPLLLYFGKESRGLCAFGVTLPDEVMEKILPHLGTGQLVTEKRGGLWIYGDGEQIFFDLAEFQRTELLLTGALASGSGAAENDREKEGNEARNFEIFRTKRGEELQKLLETMDLHPGIPEDERFRTICRFLAGEAPDSGPDGSPGEAADIGPEGQEEKLRAAVRYLIGRGPGLTPTGDDILTGYGAVLRWYGAGRKKNSTAGLPEEGPKETQAFFAAVRRETGRTNDVSRAYLGACDRGFANEPFRELLLGELTPEELKTAAERVRALGSTSGEDTLFGALLALKRIGRFRLP